jgi:hypothetical protein
MKTIQALLAAFLVWALPAAVYADAGEATPGKSLSSEANATEKLDTSFFATHFRSSVFFFDQSVTPDTVDAGAQQSQIPSYQWWLSFRPRYYVTPKFSFRLRADLTVEWLNAADTTRKREAQWGDIWTDAMYELPKFGGIATSVGLRAIWGTSLEAMGNTSIVKLGPNVFMDRPFATRIGEFGLSLGMYATYNFVTDTSAVSQSRYGCAATDFAPTSCGINSSGAMNPQVTLVTLVMARYTPTPKLTIGANYIIIDNWLYNTPDAALVDATGGTQPIARSSSDQHFRQSSWFLASIDYDINKWFTASLGYYCYRPILDPDGTYGNPFYAPGGASRIFLTGTFALDRLYSAIAGRVARSRAPAASLTPSLALPGGATASF